MARYFRTALVVLPVILLVGVVAWLFFFPLDESDAQTADAQLSVQTAVAVAPEESSLPPESAAAAVEPPGHLSIVRQSFARGGLGSKALVTFTLRNDNHFAVKDPEILCSFRSRDGRYSTERRRIITDTTLNTKSHKTFPYTFIGFVNIKASQAKCSVLAATRA